MRGLGGLLTVLLALTTELAAALLMLRAYDAASGQPWASRLSSWLGHAGDGAFPLTAIVFVVWFYRARTNAENSSWRQRRARGWTFWGWIVPIANFFVPFQLMGDIWRAGLPASQRGKTAWLPALWWIAWLLSGISTGDQRSWNSSGPPQSGVTFGFGLSLPGASSFSLCALAISGALVIQIVRAVNAGPVAGAPAAGYGNLAQPRTQRKAPSRVVATLGLAAVLGLAGSAAAAVGVIGVRTYHADTVRLRTGNTVQVVLSPGSYHVYVGCANDGGCPQLPAGGLSVQGALNTPSGIASGMEMSTLAGRPFLIEHSFGIPARETMRFTLRTRLTQPVFIAPSEDRLSALRWWIAVAAISGAVLFGVSAALAWPVTRRDTAGPD